MTASNVVRILRPKRGRISLFAIILFAILIGVVNRLDGAEQRCGELDAQYGSGTCVCSEPLQATGYTGGPSFWDANDSTSLECGYEMANRPITRNQSDLQVGTNLEAINALPAGSTARANGRFLRADDAHQDTFFVGHDFSLNTGSGTMQRFAVRVYRYYSPNFAFADERNTSPPNGTTFVQDFSNAGCRNSKWFQHEHNLIYDSHDGPVGAYGYQGGWSPQLDCCASGYPGYDSNDPGPNGNSRRGKWWRYETVIVNPSGGASPNGLKFYLYAKNVTDNTPEVKILDSTIPCTGCGFDDWTDISGATHSLTPPSRMTDIALNNFRQHGDSTNCTGYEGTMYLLAAMWSTDAGQRIGPAVEVEGGQNNPGGNPVAATGDGGDGCFIATAAYGSPLAPQVELLRDFRNRHLLPYSPGQALVRFYYRLSPPLANIIADSDLLRAIVRLALLPILAWTTLVLWSPPLGLAALLLILGLLLWPPLRLLRKLRTIKATFKPISNIER